ncbi:MAG TPA: hypothetical protein DDY98_02930 [Ruminococcaceae bacterium]|nr:hypothetical protein [Oscillospiraceae bacterium]
MRLKLRQLCLKMRRLFDTTYFMLFQMILAVLITTFDLEVIGAVIFVVVFCATLFACKDLTKTTLPFLLLSMTVIKCFDSFDVFIKVAPLAVLVVACLAVFFKRNMTKRKLGPTFYGAFAVGVAVTLGGFGIINPRAYFSLTSLYYTLGLGFGMVIAYWVINGCCENDEKNSLGESFVLIMTLVTAFGSFMVFEHYLENLDLVLAKDGIIPFQWRNNVSTFLMFGLPFPFYLSRKKWACSLIGWAGYAALLLGGSRGGLIFGTVEMGCCVLLTLICDKKHRKNNLLLLGALAVVAAAVGYKLIPFFRYTLERIVDYKENKTRLGLFERATEDFSSNPAFGRGLAYWGNRDLHPSKHFALCWYHSAPFQIIGSFGICGIVCFALRLLLRLKVIVTRINHYTLTMAVSFLGITMMSLVNPGEFCPLPYELITTMIFVFLEKTPQAIAVKTPKFVQQRRNRKEFAGIG